MTTRFALLTLVFSLALTLTPALFAAAPPASGKYWVYFGTYTGGKGGSQGVYRSELDLATGKLSTPEVAAEVLNPSFLAFDPTGKKMYAIGEVSAVAGKKEGGVHAFTVDAKTGKLTKLNDQTSGGPGPCHVSTDPSGKLVVVANYGGGSCAFLPVKEDGSLGERVAFFQHDLTKMTADGKKKAPRGHSGFFDDSGKFAYVADLGLDQVLVYKVEGGKVTANEPPFIQLPAGCGPRHLHINAKNDVMYVCGELDSTIQVVKMDAKSGKFEHIQSASTLPNPVKGNSTAEVRIHPSGKFVYVSNRGHNSIVAFKILDDGKVDPKPIGWATEGIKIPRNFNIDPTGKWMLVASQDGDNVAVFAIDQETGLPKPTGNTVNVGKPVCVKFLAQE